MHINPLLSTGITMLMKRSTAEYIHSVQDLLDNEHVLFGCLDSGSTYNFFRVSRDVNPNYTDSILSLINNHSEWKG